MIKSHDFIFMAICPVWSPIPEVPFYGYMELEMLFEPGFQKQFYLIIDENRIFQKSSEFEKFISDNSYTYNIQEVAKSKFPELF